MKKLLLVLYERLDRIQRLRRRAESLPIQSYRYTGLDVSRVLWKKQNGVTSC